jgi:hypothetical protein
MRIALTKNIVPFCSRLRLERIRAKVFELSDWYEMHKFVATGQIQFRFSSMILTDWLYYVQTHQSAVLLLKVRPGKDISAYRLR